MKLLLGERYRAKLEKPLMQVGAECVWMPDNPALDPRLSAHADLSVFFPEPSTAIAAKGMYPYFVNILTNNGRSVISSQEQSKEYPKDAGLCVCSTGTYTIYSSGTIDPNALPFLRGNRIDVPQGYTRCSVCVVSDDAIITADDVIAHRALEAGMDVLHIAPGHIILEGYDTGFIGGASFLIKKELLAFTGHLDEHPDKGRILAFLGKHGVFPLFLTNDPIFDIGSAVTLP